MMSRFLSPNVFLGIAPILLVIAVWQGLVSFGFAPAVLLPPPGFVLVVSVFRFRHFFLPPSPLPPPSSE